MGDIGPRPTPEDRRISEEIAEGARLIAGDTKEKRELLSEREVLKARIRELNEKVRQIEGK